MGEVVVTEGEGGEEVAEEAAEATEAAAEAVEAAAEATEAAAEAAEEVAEAAGEVAGGGGEGSHEFELHERLVRAEEQHAAHVGDFERHAGPGLSHDEVRAIVDERVAALAAVAEPAPEDEDVTIVEPDIPEEEPRRSLLHRVW